MNLKCKE